MWSFPFAKPLPPMRPVDLVFLRNVLIYFDRKTKSQILGQVHQVLRDDGVLLLGTAESTLGLCDGFQLRAHDKATCFLRTA